MKIRYSYVFISLLLVMISLADVCSFASLQDRFLQETSTFDKQLYSELSQWNKNLIDSLESNLNPYWSHSLSDLKIMQYVSKIKDPVFDEEFLGLANYEFNVLKSNMLQLNFFNNFPYLQESDIKVSKVMTLQNQLSKDNIDFMLLSKDDNTNKYNLELIITIGKESITQNGYFEFTVKSKNAQWNYCKASPLNSDHCKIDLQIMAIGDLNKFQCNISVSDDQHNTLKNAIKIDLKSSIMFSIGIFRSLGLAFYHFFSFILYISIVLWAEISFDRPKYYAINRIWKWCFFFFLTVICHLQLKITLDSLKFYSNFMEPLSLKIWFPAIISLGILIMSMILPLTTPNWFLGEGTDPNGWHLWFKILVWTNIVYYLAIYYCHYSGIIDYGQIMNKITLNPYTYLFFCTFYGLMIIMNSVFKTRHFSYQTISVVILCLYLGTYPFTIFGPSHQIHEYDRSWFGYFVLINLILLMILIIQCRNGSRFFLPRIYRQKYHDKYRYKLEDHPEDIGSECDMCMNLLSEGELEYINLEQSFDYKDLEHYYYKLDWEHKFHPACFKKHQKQNVGQCSKWGYNIGIDYFID